MQRQGTGLGKTVSREGAGTADRGFPKLVGVCGVNDEMSFIPWA
jgi:hypothetical protein